MLSRVKLCLGAAADGCGPDMTLPRPPSRRPSNLSIDRSTAPSSPPPAGEMASFLGSPHGQGRLETFDGYKAWDGTGTTNPQNTKVGSFTSFGAAGSGRSVVGDAAKLQVRNDRPCPGAATAPTRPPLGGNWLDSNDNLGMRWEVGGLGKFNTLAFFVLDAADVGGKFSIKVGDTLYSNLAGAGGKLANGNIQFVRILLSEAVTTSPSS